MLFFKIKIFHLCFARVVRVALVLHLCSTRVTRVSLVSLVSHSCHICVAHVTLVSLVFGTPVVIRLDPLHE